MSLQEYRHIYRSAEGKQITISDPHLTNKRLEMSCMVCRIKENGQKVITGTGSSFPSPLSSGEPLSAGTNSGNITRKTQSPSWMLLTNTRSSY